MRNWIMKRKLWLDGWVSGGVNFEKRSFGGHFENRGKWGKIRILKSRRNQKKEKMNNDKSHLNFQNSSLASDFENYLDHLKEEIKRNIGVVENHEMVKKWGRIAQSKIWFFIAKNSYSLIVFVFIKLVKQAGHLLENRPSCKANDEVWKILNSTWLIAASPVPLISKFSSHLSQFEKLD